MLFDRMLRHQVYLEGLKTGTSRKLNRKLLADLEKIVTKEIKRLPNERLDALTTRGINTIAGRIAAAQRKLAKEWERAVKAELREYAKAEAKLSAKLFKATGKRPVVPNVKDLWAEINAGSVKATGDDFSQTLSKMTAQHTGAIRTQLRLMWKQGKTTDEFMAAFKGTQERGYKDGLLRKFDNQSRTVISTTMQHVKSTVQQSVAEDYFRRYKWVSVIDTGTTDICRRRNGKIYVYGKGPMPPAHYNCRSSTVPYSKEIEYPTDDDPPFFDWVQRQPEEFIRDIFSKRDAEALIKGTAKRKDFEHFNGIGPMTLKQFEGKTEIILLE